MPVTLNASTSSGLIATSDTSGNIELQANGVTKATVSSSGLAIGQYTPSTSLITSDTAKASTSGTSIDFTGIPSWVKRVTVSFNAVSTNGSSALLMQVGAGSVATSGYTSQAAQVTSATTSTSGFVLTFSSGASSNRAGIATICLVSSNTWVSSAIMSCPDNGLQIATSGGTVALGGALDRVRITTVNGTDTFDAGSINILYE
jgi:hypothetical protein